MVTYTPINIAQALEQLRVEIANGFHEIHEHLHAQRINMSIIHHNQNHAAVEFKPLLKTVSTINIIYLDCVNLIILEPRSWP